MFAAIHGETIIKMALAFQEVEKGMPSSLPLLAIHEGVHVADEYDAVPSTGDEDIQTLWGGHETDVSGCVAAGKGRDHNVAFLALIIV
jgi:hypothetical protein